jgi:glycosyltransferase involved in cell wall biosynthesis
LKALGKKVIYDVHEDYKSKILSKYYIPRFLRRPLAHLFDLFEKTASKIFDAIIVVDDYLLSRFRHRRVVKVAHFPPIIEIPRKKQNDEFVFVYAGGINKDRGISKVIQALGFLGDYKGEMKIILAGPIEEEYLKQAVENNPFIDYVGYLPWREVLKIYSVSDVGLLLLQPVPAYITTETPVKLFEYMLAGLAVLSANFPSLKKIIEGNKCGICVDSTNPREIADAMKYLIEHKEEARKMGENGKRAVIERYNWEKESEKLLKLYKELLRER